VAGYLSRAVDAGARLLVGGSVGGPNETCFEATVIEPASVDSDAWTREIFGPVGLIAPFGSYDEAIDLANQTDYGLSASVWSTDEATLTQFADDVQAGVCWMNTFGLFDIGVPWGGIKQSGYGRELSLSAIDEFTNLKVVY
jgi:phenylacetaldehyde dehydrogenase